MSRGAKPGVWGLHDALVCAIDHGHEDIAIFLLDQGWPPRRPALENAVYKGTLNLVKRLLAAGASCSHELLCQTIQWEKEAEAVELIHAGAPVWPKSKNSFVPALHNAVKKGLIRVVRAMIETNADLNRRDDIDILEPVSTETKKAARSKKGLASKRHLEIEAFRTTALIVAVRCNHKEMAQLLLNGGADLEVTDGDKMTALDWAQKLGREQIIPLLQNKR